MFHLKERKVMGNPRNESNDAGVLLSFPFAVPVFFLCISNKKGSLQHLAVYSVNISADWLQR